MSRSTGSATVAGVDGFARFCAAVAAGLPFGLNRVVAPSVIGFVLINGFTFAVDLTLLGVLHGLWRWPVPAAISVAYAVAFGLSFLLNRVFNFRSHGRWGRQTALYVIAVLVNYVVILLGVGAGLARVGIDYRVARIVAGMCEGGFMYCVMRWLVFGRARPVESPEGE